MSNKGRSDIIAELSVLTDTLRTTIGPYGARKLVVEQSGNVTVTASCAAVLDRLRVDNPAVTLLESTTSGFRESHGDGVSRLVVLTGALLEAAESLSDRGLRSTTIERGFREGLSMATQRLDNLERPLASVGADAVAHTALTDVRNSATKEYFSTAVGRAIDELEASNERFETKDLTVATRIGAGQAESDLVHGVVLDRPPAVEEMPRSPGTTGIALVSETVDVPKLGGATARTNNRYSLDASTLDEKQAFAERERLAFQRQLDALLNHDCRVIVTKKGINERVEMHLANHGVLALQRLDDNNFRRLARATGATVVSRLNEVTPETLGHGSVNVVREAGRDMSIVESIGSQPVYTLFCRSPDQRSLEALERSIESAIASVHSARETGHVVPGGGASEMAAARAVERASRSIDDVHQLAATEFADAMTAVPRMLAKTTGLDGLDALVQLRRDHAEGRETTGVDCMSGDTTDVLSTDARPIVDPSLLTREIWSAATDLAVQIGRIDGQLAASDLEAHFSTAATPGIDGPRGE